MNTVESACPSCGMRRRPGWFRCPRCREILPEEVSQPVAIARSGAASALAEPRRPIWVWAAGGSAIAGVVFVAGLVTGTTTSSAPAAQSQGPSVNGPQRQPAPNSRRRPIDSEVASTHAAAAARKTGDAAYAKGDLDQARAEYEAAVAANPNDPDARNNLAQVLMRLNLPSLALIHLDEAVRINSQKWAYRFNRARAYGDSSRLAEAAAEYQAAAQLFPEDYATQYNLGLTRMKLQHYADAAVALEEAVKLAPEEASFLITLGTAYVGVQKPDRARATFEQFLAQAPDDADVPRVKALLTALDAARQQNEELRTKN
jgi:tetratricopeptide (TPR) repeat protein